MTNWQEKIKKTWNDRSSLTDNPNFESFRVFHGYAEGVAGVVIEKFGDMAVIDYKVDIRAELDALKNALLGVYPWRYIVARGHQSMKLPLSERVFHLHGDVGDAPDFVREYGRHFHIKADAVHSVGLYLDARPVRAWLGENSKDRRILNLFAFTGSLGATAAAAGAKEVVHLDKSKELLPRIRETYRKNSLVFDDRSFLRGDIYKHLPRAIKAGQSFDGIILDPPPKVYQSDFAGHKTNGQDFPALVSHCANLMRPGAWLIAMFHRFDITWEVFETQVLEAAAGKLRVDHRFNSDIDFPEENPEHKLRVTVFTTN